MYSDEDGKLAVRFSRQVIDSVTHKKPLPNTELPPLFDENSGVFVTISTYPKKELRGCIGYPLPYFPLKEALAKASENATNDPRFPRLSRKELDGVVVEVSILTPPEIIEVDAPMGYLKEVKVGRDGLIMKRGGLSGLLLPQVPLEWGWDTKTFLSQTCNKAGLMPDCWLEPGVEIYRFTAEIWAEEKPRGNIISKELGEL